MKGNKVKEDTKPPAPPTKAVKKKALTPRKKRAVTALEKSTSETPNKSEEKKVTKSDVKKAKNVIKSDKVKKGVVGKKGKDPEEKVKVAVKKRRRKIDKGIMARRKLER